MINPSSTVKSIDPPPPPPPPPLEDEGGALTVTVACTLLLEVSGSDAAETTATDALATALPAVLAVAGIDRDCEAPFVIAPRVQVT